MGTVIDGKAMAKKIREELKEEVQEKKKHGVTPGLAVVLVGEDPASRVYVNSKKKACEQVGIYSEEHHLPETASEDEVLSLVEKLNLDPKIHGILVQLPLPTGLRESKILNRIHPDKDVDGFHPINVGRLSLGEECFVPCTPLGVVEMLKRMKVDLVGKEVVIVGRSNIVGKPAALLLLREHATVTICHSRTKDLRAKCKEADILVVAVGRPEMVKKDWVKPGAIVMDVGINRLAERLVGDVDYADVFEVAGAITPVPGGVGPMTIAMLLKNTVDACKD